jgi:hypothetical protein
MANLARSEPEGSNDVENLLIENLHSQGQTVEGKSQRGEVLSGLRVGLVGPVGRGSDTGGGFGARLRMS